MATSSLIIACLINDLTLVKRSMGIYIFQVRYKKDICVMVELI
jgi:hypothetical protein